MQSGLHTHSAGWWPAVAGFLWRTDRGIGYSRTWISSAVEKYICKHVVEKEIRKNLSVGVSGEVQLTQRNRTAWWAGGSTIQDVSSQLIEIPLKVNLHFTTEFQTRFANNSVCLVNYVSSSWSKFYLLLFIFFLSPVTFTFFLYVSFILFFLDPTGHIHIKIQDPLLVSLSTPVTLDHT